jgi:hypothetical protein
MPGHARKEIVREGEIGTYHCWSRCVQRAFLCGYDPLTGRDFDYRRGWIEDLLAYLAGLFAIDVGNYSVLSNHLHTLLRTRPDVAAHWSAEEVALRWKLAWPELRDGQWVREVSDAELEQLLADPQQLAKIRQRLSSLSWFMARLKEPIARICNAEMETSGHFWDGRFHSRELLDDVAVLTDSIYLDLNQTRAGLADSLEDSRHSAIRQRILAAKARQAHASWEDVSGREGPAGSAFTLAQAEMLYDDCWLSPISTEGPLLTTEVGWGPAATGSSTAGRGPLFIATDERLSSDAASSPAEPPGQSAAGESPRATREQEEQAAASASGAAVERPRLTRRRASDAPFIGVSWSEYWRVVQALCGRHTRAARAEADSGAREPGQETLEAGLRDTLRRWGMNPEGWLAGLAQLDRQCQRALGRVDRLLDRAQQVARQRFHGVRLCRALFAADRPEGFT